MKVSLHNLGEHLFLTLIAAAGTLFFGAALYEDVRPRPVTRVQGIIVDKQWQPAYVRHFKHSDEVEPEKYLIWVANRESVRGVRVDAATWQQLRVGQPASYRYKPAAWW